MQGRKEGDSDNRIGTILFSDQNRLESGSPIMEGLGTLFGIRREKKRAVDPNLEYLFEEEYEGLTGPSWGARICHGTGIVYLGTLAVGGLWGLSDGLRNPIGQKSYRLRLNSVVNGCTARGPFLANNISALALMYNLIHGGLLKVTKRDQDLYSSVGSAAIAGLLYRSTRGPGTAALFSFTTATAMAMYQLAMRKATVY